MSAILIWFTELLGEDSEHRLFYFGVEFIKKIQDELSWRLLLIKGLS